MQFSSDMTEMSLSIRKWTVNSSKMKSGTILSQEDQFNNSNAKKKDISKNTEKHVCQIFHFLKKVFNIWDVFVPQIILE